MVRRPWLRGARGAIYLLPLVLSGCSAGYRVLEVPGPPPIVEYGEEMPDWATEAEVVGDTELDADFDGLPDAEEHVGDHALPDLNTPDPPDDSEDCLGMHHLDPNIRQIILDASSESACQRECDARLLARSQSLCAEHCPTHQNCQNGPTCVIHGTAKTTVRSKAREHEGHFDCVCVTDAIDCPCACVADAADMASEDIHQDTYHGVEPRVDRDPPDPIGADECLGDHPLAVRTQNYSGAPSISACGRACVTKLTRDIQVPCVEHCRTHTCAPPTCEIQLQKTNPDGEVEGDSAQVQRFGVKAFHHTEPGIDHYDCNCWTLITRCPCNCLD